MRHEHVLSKSPQVLYLTLKSFHDIIRIFELKVNADADVALRQIDEKGYARPFEGDSRKLFKIGVNFSTATRRIEDWKIV